MLPLADPQRFVGRHRDLVALGEAFETRSRLITLHGPRGVGKSRMASEHLHAVASERRALSVDLGQCHSLNDALALIASRIGAPPATGRDPVLVLGESLRELGPTTLVLDAVEGVHDALRSVLTRWHKLSPETHLLVTAVLPLGIEHEAALSVEPLALPSDVSERVISDALRLWHISRGVDALKLPKTSDPEVVRLLRALGGLPLAIEIAAAHSDRLTPFALLERLPVALRTAGEVRDSAAVLGPLLDLVWSLLSKTERLVLAQCGVFASSFDRQAARQVVTTPDGSDLDSVLARLVQRRLLQPTYVSDAHATEGLPDPVRRYARDKLLALDPTHATLGRHAQLMVTRGAQLANDLEGPSGPAAILELIRMQPELMAIIAPGDDGPHNASASFALQALCVHDHVLSSHGPVDADLTRFDRWLSADEATDVPPLVLCEARCVRAFVRARMGQMSEAREDLVEAERLVSTREYSDSYDAGRVAVTSAFVALLAGDLTLANLSIESSLRIAELTCHPRLQGIALGVQSLIRRAERKPDEAFALYERALEVHRSVLNVRFEGIVLTRLAQSHLERGELAQARERAEAARALHRTFGDRAMEGLCLVVEGTVRHATSDLDQARSALEAARPLLRAVGDASALSTATSLLGAVSAELGDLEVARALFESVTRDASERCAVRAGLWCTSLDALFGGPASEIESRQERALERLRESGDAAGLDLAALSRIGSTLSRAREARTAHDSEAAEAYLVSARASLHAARLAISRNAGASAFPERHELLTALRFTELVLGAHDSRSAEPRHTLQLPFHGRWFMPPLGERMDTTARTAMRRILVHLSLRACAAPGVAQSASALFAAGWPGENPGEENARLQVYAVLGGLRKAGLGDFLVAEPSGHFLAPSLAVTWLA